MRLGLAAAGFLVVVGCSKPEATAPGPASPPPPAPETLAGVVGDLNTLCAETWCGGGWDFTFTKLECVSAAACTLHFDAKPDGADVVAAAAIAVGGFAAVVGTDGSPTVAFETAVNDAIAEWETKQGDGALPLRGQ